MIVAIRVATERASELGRVVQHDSADVFEVCGFGVGMHGGVAEG
jgi:hypothetical protein